MAGGIEWFRWYHGSVNDPKFRLVAARSGASVAEVLAVWAMLLEAASGAQIRGQAGVPDFEALDCALGLQDGKAQAIYTAMTLRELVSAEGEVLSWEKRQPKRERVDDTSTERVRAFRERQRRETPGNADGTQGTPAPATESTETPRGEERRKEENMENNKKPARKRAAAAQLVGVEALVAAGVVEQHAKDWLLVRANKKMPLTLTAWEQTIAEAEVAGITVAAAVHKAVKQGWGGFEAKWLTERPERLPIGRQATVADAVEASAAKAQRVAATLGFDVNTEPSLLQAAEEST